MTLLQAKEAILAADNIKLKESIKAIDINDSLDEEGATLLHLCVYESEPEMATYLISQGADVNKKRLDGVSPLWLAVCLEEVALVQLFINKQADLNSANQVGLTPLHLVVKQLQFDLFKLLIEAGADPSLKAANGQSVIALCQQNKLAKFMDVLG